MKTLMLFSLILLAPPLYSQTKWIAHRSHSGTEASFRPSSPDNFGLDPEMVRYITPDSSSTDSTKVGIFVDPDPQSPPPPSVTPDSTTQGDPGATQPDTTGTSTKPNMSKGEGSGSLQSHTDQADAGTPSPEPPDRSLFWLTLGLGIPIISFGAFRIAKV